MKSAVLVCQPLPANLALKPEYIKPFLLKVSNEVRQKQAEHSITGQEVTPYELNQVNKLTDGKSMRANLELLLNNARLAARLACAMTSQEYQSRMI